MLRQAQASWVYLGLETTCAIASLADMSDPALYSVLQL